ncbi:Prp39 protein [Martiniozyma asiatica (nom. inval.)]|nr:Prp39 protein [Martiniozyma asiatica]
MEWDSLQSRVLEEPYDGDAWDKLISYNESLVNISGISKEKKRIYADFDTLLTRFPYHTTYWKRYVAVAYSMDGLSKSLIILKRALLLFPQSLDLWVDYINILIANNVLKPAEMKATFEQGAKYVGRHFLSHDYWNVYLEWTIKHDGRNSNEFISLLLRIIKIPLYEYSKYYETFTGVMGNFPIKDLIEEKSIEEWINNHYSEQLDRYSIDDIVEANSLDIISSFFEYNFEKIQRETNDRWIYESKLERVDFDLSSLSNQELQPWLDYIKFEMENGNIEQTIALFDRMVIPACLCENVWQMYARYLIQNNCNDSHIDKVFTLACDVFIPSDLLNIRYMYIKYLELVKKDPAQVKNVYLSIISNQNTNGEPVAKYLNYLMSQSSSPQTLIDDILTALNLYRKENDLHSQTTKRQKQEIQTQTLTIHDVDIQNLYSKLTYRTIGQLVVSMTSYYWFTKKISKKHDHEIVKPSVEYWYFYFNFELKEKNITNLTNIINYIKYSSSMSPIDINRLILRYVDYIFKNKTLNELNSTSREILRYFLETDVESSLHEKHFLKIRADGNNDEEAFNLRLWRQNGHPSATCDGRPTNSNPIRVADTLWRKDCFERPKFRNVEKANIPVKYIQESL